MRSVPRPWTWSRRWLIATVAGAAAATATAGLLASTLLVSTPLVSTPGAPPAAPGRPRAIRAAPAGPRRTAPAVRGGETLLAALRRTAGRYTSPGGARTGWIPGEWDGAQSVLPVIGSSPGWVHVRLAQRPNGSTAWVPDGDVELRSTPYRIVIDLPATRLTLYLDGRPVFSAPAGVGSATDPTPAGQYFVAFLEVPPTPAYGAFVIVTSAHSEAIKDWEASGDALIGIHGPLGGDYLIGKDGARISHGCIRLPEADLLRLRMVSPGSPISIIG
jgi:lipoprotein-anchoring transpeptidase ErfK/SrfK